MKSTVVIAASFFLVVAPSAVAGNRQPPRIRVSWFSQQDGRSRAGAGARIDVHDQAPGSRGQQPVAIHVGKGSVPKTVVGTTDSRPPQPVYPPLLADSPLLKTPPSGPGSFWYQDGAGHVCQYVPSTTGICFTITGASTAASSPLTPATIAADAAARLTLTPGQVKASPTNAGLTGAASWFWLDPTPSTQQVSLLLAGEAVTVTATPHVTWRFGDGSSVDGGAGVPYQPGPVPSAAITHVYQARCLPGDQSHDPYVLSSCGADGYQLVASVGWQISYRAHGPVAAAGALPTRTTSTSVAYPVSEARAFLAGGTAG